MVFKYWQLAEGLGITLVDLTTGESKAYTIIKIDQENEKMEIQRDKVSLQTKLEYGADGYSVQCLNQDEQTYTYEKDPTGEILVLPQRGGHFIALQDMCQLLPGRREYVDYTAKEIKANESFTIKRKE